MNMKKSRVSIAISAVLSAACLAPATTYGVAIDVLNNRVADNDAGDALLFPFYTTTGSEAGSEATTSFSVTNTANATVAVKIRFREQKVSYDALDFIAVLSPYDKFDFWVSPGDNGRPVVTWDDTTCVVGPQPGATSAEFVDPTAYGLANTGVTAADLAVGHLEVLGMATLGDNACVTSSGMPSTVEPANGRCAAGDISLKAAATHSGSGAAREPANCQILMDFFSNQYGNSVRAANLDTETGVTPFFQDAPNSLIGRYLVTIPGRGVEAGEKAISIQNSNLTAAGDGVASPNPMYVTAQSADQCEQNAPGAEGNQFGNCKNALYEWDTQEFAHPHLGDMRNLANLQGLMNAATGTPTRALNLSGDWSVNPGNNVNVNWVVSFPNKYVYLDLLPKNECGGTGDAKAWCLLDRPPQAVAARVDQYGDQGGAYARECATNTDTNAACVDTVTPIDVITVEGVGSVEVGGDTTTGDTTITVTAQVDTDNNPATPPETVTTNIDLVYEPGDQGGASASAPVPSALFATPAGAPAEISVQQVTDRGGDGVIVAVDASGRIMLEPTGETTAAGTPIYAPVVVTNNPVLAGTRSITVRSDEVGGVEKANSLNLCSSSNMKIWGSDEQTATNYTISPGGGSQIQLCNEVNVLSFNKGADVEPSLIQTDANRKVINVTVDAQRGWAYLPMGNQSGDTVVGLNFTTRNTDDVTANNGTITELNKILTPQ